MPLPISSLSQVCRAIADFVSAGLQASAHSIRIMIGNPADAVPGQSDTDHRLNLFFYLIEPAGFFPDTNPGDPWWLRLHCLITGFGVAEDQISSGENDLRLLGEVIRLFHENPVLANLQVEDEVFHLQVIFQQLNPDDLNHIWSTQGEVSYRPSVVYEMSLTPVIPTQRALGSPLVGTVGQQIRGDLIAATAPWGGVIWAPPVRPTVVNTAPEDWSPVICLIYQGAAAQSLTFARDDNALDNFQPAVWVAGKVGDMVTLVWEKWTSTQGWQRQGTTLNTTATSPAIDPDQADQAVTTSFALPFDPQEVGQAVLYAERTYRRGSDGQEITVRSNPVLITIY
ncbi:MAG: DUF4255 domain-containing protein [Desulfobacca sp.]|nr:DUF4255 domain-containing protein [Desulfobacca sp.]